MTTVGLKNLKESGFSLLEVLIALLMFSIVILAASGAQNQYLRSNHEGQIKSEAAQVAQTVVDQLRQAEINTMRTSGSDSRRTIVMNSNRSYSVDVSYCTDSSLCPTSNVRQISLQVLRDGEVIYKTETVFTDLGAAPSATPTPASTSSATPIPSPTTTPTPTPTPSPSATPTPTATATISPSRTPTLSPSPTRTPSPSRTPTPSPTPRPTRCRWWNC